MSLHMAKLFMFLVILAAVLSRSHAAAWGVQLRKQSRDMARPGYPDVSEASGTEPIGDYQRKTQAPMVWLSLKKNMVSQIVPTWLFPVQHGFRRRSSANPWLHAAEGR